MRQRSPTNYAAPFGLLLSHPYSFKKLSIQGCHFFIIINLIKESILLPTMVKFFPQNLFSSDEPIMIIVDKYLILMILRKITTLCSSMMGRPDLRPQLMKVRTRKLVLSRAGRTRFQ